MTLCLILKAKHLVLAFAGIVVDVKVSSGYRFVEARYVLVFVERLCGINVDQLSKQLSSQYCSSLIIIICFFIHCCSNFSSFSDFQLIRIFLERFLAIHFS